MAGSHEPHAIPPTVEHPGVGLIQFSQVAFYCLGITICFLFASVFLFFINGYQCTAPLGSDTYPQGEEGNHVGKDLASLANLQYEGLDSNKRVRIVTFNLAPKGSRVQREGLVTRAPREVVDHELVKPGRQHSGNFRIVSFFEHPTRGSCVMYGTAFAVTKFHILTVGHNLWDPKLGPAKRAVLYLDDREARDGKHFNTCVTVALNADWVRRYRAENDFCMVAVAEPFNSSVRILRCHPQPGPSCSGNGIIIGFPYDLPFNAPGKHLIQSEGSVSYRQSKALLILEHWINTQGGNSGSPVIVNDRVVGVHSTFICGLGEKTNRAAPVNSNGNNVDHFSTLLRYMRGQLSKLPEEIEDLGEITCVTTTVRTFNDNTTSDC
ncbi:hypothetical protein F5Y03DRAFT_338447 [Xylaria venustula]|nr:hypothetical protein F5Y03DRAFT_338447 [Xylaria venustula]